MRQNRIILITTGIAAATAIVAIVGALLVFMFSDGSLHGGENLEERANETEQEEQARELPLEAGKPTRPPTPPQVD